MSLVQAPFSPGVVRLTLHHAARCNRREGRPARSHVFSWKCALWHISTDGGFLLVLPPVICPSACRTPTVVSRTDTRDRDAPCPVAPPSPPGRAHLHCTIAPPDSSRTVRREYPTPEPTWVGASPYGSSFRRRSMTADRSRNSAGDCASHRRRTAISSVRWPSLR